MVYEWGSSRFPIDPNVAAREVSRVAAKQPDKAALAADLVKASRPKRAVLHDVIFAESDEEAAEKHRLVIARKVVHSLVAVQGTNGDTQRVPAFFHVDFQNDEGERVQGYQPVEVVIADPGARQSAEDQLRREIEGLQRRFDGLGDFSEVWEALERVAEKAT